MEEISANSLDQMKIPEIRKLLADRGLDTSGSKTALISRLTAFTKQSCEFDNNGGLNGNLSYGKDSQVADDGKLFSSL